MKREKLLLNDVHLGVIRTSGTTPQTAMAIRERLQQQLQDLLMQHLDKDIIVNGDLFDTFNVPMQDVLRFYVTAAAWLNASEAPQVTPDRAPESPFMVLGEGNHDKSKDSSKMSSFAFIARILQAQFPYRVLIVTEPSMVFDDIYMIPHMPNQDQFDLELTKVPEGAGMVLLHANYDNHFAVEADHSLNVSEQQAVKLIGPTGDYPERFLVFGHEHQSRSCLGGYLFVTGNQWPSSVADCLNNPKGLKHAHVLKPSDGGYGIHPIQTWDAAEGFAEIPWDELASTICADGVKFIRVVGEATAEQAPDVIKAIAGYRKVSEALVITNAVKIEGVSDMEELNVSMEDVKNFDVLAYLLENLDEDQAAVVKELLGAEDERKAA